MRNIRKKIEIPDEISKTLEIASGYMKNEVTDWIVIKRMLLLTLPVRFRRMFSTRDPKTKAQRTNAFEFKLIEHWFNLTGVKLNY